MLYNDVHKILGIILQALLTAPPPNRLLSFQCLGVNTFGLTSTDEICLTVNAFMNIAVLAQLMSKNVTVQFDAIPQKNKRISNAIEKPVKKIHIHKYWI